MRLPDTVRSSGTVLKLPLQFENIAAMPLTVHITVLSFSCEAGIAQVLPESQVIMLQPKQYSIHTIAVTLPEIFHDEGLYAADIRVDCLVNGTTLFSHAETVTLTVAAPWFHQMLRKSAALQIPIVQAVGGLVMFTVLLLAGQCIIRYRKKYPALALKQNPLLRSAANQRLVHSPTVPHYTSAVCPIKAPIQLPCLISETLELFVLHQNTAIGKRNIHLLKAGSTMTVGGAKRDDFLIFLVPFPACLAEICYDGTHYNLLIKKPEFFPYEQKPVISDCIGKITTIISDKGYPVSFMFRGYQDPAVRLNALLTSIQKKQ
ncbi:MAG: hypothetical protein ACTTH7_05020 [Treponema sp.]